MTRKGYTKNGDGMWADGAGKTVSFQIVTFPQHPSATPVAPIITQQLKRGGFDASFLLPADFVSRITTGDAEAFLWGHGGAMKDPYKTLDLYNARYVKPTPTPIFFTNIYRWSNADFSDIVDKMGTYPEDDPAVMPLWQQAMQTWLPELPDIPLIQTVIALPMNTTYWTNWPARRPPVHPRGLLAPQRAAHLPERQTDAGVVTRSCILPSSFRRGGIGFRRSADSAGWRTGRDPGRS